jgi:hypothetical protein
LLPWGDEAAGRNIDGSLHYPPFYWVRTPLSAG